MNINHSVNLLSFCSFVIPIHCKGFFRVFQKFHFESEFSFGGFFWFKYLLISFAFSLFLYFLVEFNFLNLWGASKEMFLSLVPVISRYFLLDFPLFPLKLLILDLCNSGFCAFPLWNYFNFDSYLHQEFLFQQ